MAVGDWLYTLHSRRSRRILEVEPVVTVDIGEDMMIVATFLCSDVATGHWASFDIDQAVLDGEQASKECQDSKLVSYYRLDSLRLGPEVDGGALHFICTK